MTAHLDPSSGELPSILYQDDRLVAVHKPAGLLVHRSFLDPKETRFALQLVRDLLGRRVFPVHRLDRATSGVLIFALDPRTATLLGDLFAAGQVHKTYLAVTRGWTPRELVIDHPLTETDPRALDPRAPRPPTTQPAVTRLERLAAWELPFPRGPHSTCRYSLVRLFPETGRRHQLRRHLKHVFHPIIGDTTHGDGWDNRLFRRELGCDRLLLAAVSLALPHPVTGQPLVVEAPPEPSMARVIQWIVERSL